MNTAENLNHDTDDNELFLVDGSGFIFRAYYAMAYSGRGGMTNPEGTPVGAVYGFTSMIIKMLRDYNAPNLAVIFDAGRETFRNNIYAEYKANRDATPEDLIPQFPLIREATEAFDLPAIDLPGYEADDLIAAYAKLARAQGRSVTIVSSDKDLMQLVGDGVRMLDPMKGHFVGPDEVAEKFGVTPDKVVDVQALAGDSADNVPGVPGIGVKTAAQLINEYGDLETLLERAGEVKQNKRRESLIEFADQARMSKLLVKLDDEAPVPVPLDDLKAHDPDKPALVDFLKKHEFNSILKRLGQAPVEAVPAADESEAEPQDSGVDFPEISENVYTLITDGETLKAWMGEAYTAGVLAIDTETTSLTPAKADLVGISLSSSLGRAAYIPMGHAVEVDLLGQTNSDIDQMRAGDVADIMRAVLTDDSVMKIGHNMKYDWQIIKRALDIEMHPCDDTMLMSYVLDGSSHKHGMDFLSEHYFDHKPIPYSEVAGKGKSQVTFDKVDIGVALDYAAEDAEITLRLHKMLEPRIPLERMAYVYEEIERPLIPVIAQMELEGIKVDPIKLKEMSAEFAKKLAVLEADIHKLAGQEFNIGSPKQIGEILFDVMGLQGGKKTKTGQWATDVKVLEELAHQGHEIVQKVLEWRGLSKLKSTYTDALQEQINPLTARVHTSYHMTGTSTGRLASSDPNLQNIPIRTEDGRRIREAFIAGDECTLLSVDYSQVELRLAAQMAGVEALKQAFKDGVDIHTLTASQVFGVPLDQVTSDLRRQAKAVNFGIIYGISGWGLAKQLGCPPGEANEFIKKYLDAFSEIRDFMDNCKDEAHKNEYVSTLYGRKCFTPNINAKMPGLRAGAERAAINAPIQGAAADIMKLAMIKIPKALKAQGLKAKMLLQVHDELIFDVPEAELQTVLALVKSLMEGVADFDVPLIAEAGQGQSWAEAH
jgi:DNA polymerase-1